MRIGFEKAEGDEIWKNKPKFSTKCPFKLPYRVGSKSCTECKHFKGFVSRNVIECLFKPEKANQLTWKDIQAIVRIADSLLNSFDYEKVRKMGEEGYYTEILNQFNKQKV